MRNASWSDLLTCDVEHHTAAGVTMSPVLSWRNLSPRLMPWRIAFSTIVAGCCALVLYSQVYIRFERVRLIVLSAPERPAAGKSLVIALPEASRLAGHPVSIILRLSNSGADARNVGI